MLPRSLRCKPQGKRLSGRDDSGLVAVREKLRSLRLRSGQALRFAPEDRVLVSEKT